MEIYFLELNKQILAFFIIVHFYKFFWLEIMYV